MKRFGVWRRARGGWGELFGSREGSEGEEMGRVGVCVWEDVEPGDWPERVGLRR